MCHAWTYPADPEQRGLGHLRRAHCLREEKQMLGKSAGEADEDRWGDKAVLITLQISPCLVPVHPDSFHVRVAGFLVIQLLLKNLRTNSRQRFVRMNPEEQKFHCPVCTLPGIPSSVPLLSIPQLFAPVLLFTQCPGHGQEHPACSKAFLYATVSSKNSSWTRFNQQEQELFRGWPNLWVTW